MGHHFVLHIFKDASAWLIWVPTPAGSRRGRMWAQASHIELRRHEVNIRNVSLISSSCHLATVVMFTWAPPHPATSGSHKLLADLLTPGHRNMRGKSWNSPKFVSGSSPRLPGKHLVSHLSFSKFGFWWGTTTLPSLQYYKTDTILHNDDKEDNI